jgi:hypothetical protein
MGVMMPDLLPMTDPLAIYLNDHLAGSTAGAELFRRAADRATGDRTAVLQRLAQEIEEDRAALLDMMNHLDVPVRHYKVLAGWVGEKIGRFKPNGQLTGRAPLSSLIEAETMLLGVRGKAAGWAALRILADHDDRLSVERLDTLIARADAQSATLEQLRREIAAEVFVAG